MKRTGYLTTPENEDFIKGINLLRSKASSIGIKQYFSISPCKWVIPLSMMLSEYDCCYKFWENVASQNRLLRIPCCITLGDIFFGSNNLFGWRLTSQGYDYWFNICTILFERYPSGGNTSLNQL